MTAVPLAFGNLLAEQYEDDFHAAHPIIDVLREKMVIVEDPRFTREYLEADKRSIANAVQVFFKDGPAPRTWWWSTRSATVGAGPRVFLAGGQVQGEPADPIHWPAQRRDLRCARIRRGLKRRP
jgi:hypothetical protein